MSKGIESINFWRPLLASERIVLDEAVADPDERWVVLIGEGSASEQTLEFLRDVWPDVECDPH